MTTRNIRWGALSATAMVAATALAPVAARADWRQDRNNQNNKNLMRNLAIGGAAIGAYGLFNHNSTLGLLGLAGGALAGSQYEKDRHQQSVDNSHDQYQYFHRNGNGGGNGYYNGYNFRHQGGGSVYGWRGNQDGGR